MKNKNVNKVVGSLICLMFIVTIFLPIFLNFNNSQNNVAIEKDNLDLKSSTSGYITFHLLDENGFIYDNDASGLFYLAIGSLGNGKPFGEPVLVSTIENAKIWVYDRFNIRIFYEVVDLSGVSEYNIIHNIINLTINLKASEIGEFTIKREPDGLTKPFSMNPNTTVVITLGEGQYSATWINGEDGSFHEYNFYINSNMEITLDSIYYDISFTLSDQFLNELNTSLYSLYVDGIEREFGIEMELDTEDVLITVYDRFNITGFNSTVYLREFSVYNIIVSIYKLKIQHLASEIGRLSLKEVTTGNTHNFSMNPESNKIFKLTNGNYEVSWLNGENSQIYIYDINLDSDYDLILKSIYYDIYFSIFSFDGIGLDHDLVRFYLNGERTDFGFTVLDTKYNNLLILDFFDNVLYDETVDLSGKTEWNIYVEMYSVEIKNAYNYAIDLVFFRNNLSVSITVPAQFSILYRFILNVEYNIIWYKSSTQEEIGSIEVMFTKNNLILSFGSEITEDLDDKEPDKFNIFLIVSIVSIISIISGICIVVLKFRKKIVSIIKKRFSHKKEVK